MVLIQYPPESQYPYDILIVVIIISAYLGAIVFFNYFYPKLISLLKQLDNKVRKSPSKIDDSKDNNLISKINIFISIAAFTIPAIVVIVPLLMSPILDYKIEKVNGSDTSITQTYNIIINNVGVSKANDVMVSLLSENLNVS